jgi:hypothetical protein
MCSLGEAANAATAKLLKNIEMKWSRIDLSKSTHQLLTSDRPIDMPLGLADPEAYISLPVSPRILFVLPRPESTYNDCATIAEVTYNDCATIAEDCATLLRFH